MGPSEGMGSRRASHWFMGPKSWVPCQRGSSPAIRKAAGAQAELEALRAGSAPEESLASLERSDAIRAVLRSVDVSLSPSEIRERLVEARRSDRLNEITATLKYLLDKEVVQHPDRGRYNAV